MQKKNQKIATCSGPVALRTAPHDNRTGSSEPCSSVSLDYQKTSCLPPDYPKTSCRRRLLRTSAIAIPVIVRLRQPHPLRHILSWPVASKLIYTDFPIVSLPVKLHLTPREKKQPRRTVPTGELKFRRHRIRPKTRQPQFRCDSQAAGAPLARESPNPISTAPKRHV